jgi:hypothetical protein
MFKPSGVRQDIPIKESSDSQKANAKTFKPSLMGVKDRGGR